MKLYVKGTDIEVKAGNLVTSFRGEKGKVADDVGEAPAYAGTTGRIYVHMPVGDEFLDKPYVYYPSVFNCEWR